MVPGLSFSAMSDADSLRQQHVIHGLWSTTGDQGVIDTASAVGPDFIVVDTQHGIDLGQVDASLFTVMAGYGVAGLVRVESLDAGRIGRALDLGASGIIVPLVESADDASRAVHATRHAPRGGRSFGMQTRRVGPFDQRPFVVIQVETAGAIADLEAIAAVDGIDALYIGPADLGLGLGGSPAPDVGEVFDGSHEHAEQLVVAFAGVIEAANANGIVPGLHCGNGASSARAVSEGFRMTSVAVDLSLIGTGLREQLEAARHTRA